MKPFITLIALALVCVTVAPSRAQDVAVSHDRGNPVEAGTRSGYVDVNGLKMHYQIHGEGDPLILLHGGLGLADMFAPILPALASKRQVIAVDLQGHGRTADIDRPIRYERLADDIAGLLAHLDIERADVAGYSFGGATALRFAIQYPDKVRRLVIVSSPFRQDGWYPEILQSQKTLDGRAAEMMKNTPMYESYAAVAPNPEHFAQLLDKMGDLMRQEYDWSQEISRLTMPVMLIYGDSDMVRAEHVVEFYQLLGGGKRDAGWMREHMPVNRLAILPNLTHYEVFAAPVLAQTILPFLDGYGSVAN